MELRWPKMCCDVNMLTSSLQNGPPYTSTSAKKVNIKFKCISCLESVIETGECIKVVIKIYRPWRGKECDDKLDDEG
jgi:hypothetical protein